jgi:4a-hydroxytetrahydrobiopterin dehydratase
LKVAFSYTKATQPAMRLNMITIPQSWNGDATRINKLFTFSSFMAAMRFMSEVALFCDKTDHHPEWKNIYNKVWVTLTTHDAGKVTEKDLALASHMDAVAQRVMADTTPTK